METARKFRVSANGDDARTLYTTDSYEDARTTARQMSVDHWLGHKVIGPSGKLMTFANGTETGYRDSTAGWVTK